MIMVVDFLALGSLAFCVDHAIDKRIVRTAAVLAAIAAGLAMTVGGLAAHG